MKYKAIVSSNIYGEKSSEVEFFASFEELMEIFYDDSFGEVKTVEELQDAFNEEQKRIYDGRTTIWKLRFSQNNLKGLQLNWLEHSTHNGQVSSSSLDGPTN